MLQIAVNIIHYRILRLVDRASLYNHFQMKPTRCTLILSIFISISVHVSGNYVPIIRRTYCIYATLVFFTVYGWLSVLLVGMGLQSGGSLICWLGWDCSLVCWLGWDCGLVAVWSAGCVETAVWWLSDLLVGMGLQSGGCLIC